MPTKDTAVLAAKNGQREGARRATLDMLRDKRPAEREVAVKLNPDDEEPVTFLLRALPATAYDRLVTKHPPTTDQQADGNSFNVDTFAPALMAAVIIEPAAEDRFWRERWADPNWGRGEIASLYFACSELCNRGLDLAPFDSGSGVTATSSSS